MANARNVRRPKGRPGASIRFNLHRFCQSLGKALGVELLDSGLPDKYPVDFVDGQRAAVTYLLHEMLSKYDDGKPSPAKEAMTWSRFAEAEDLCRKTNHRLVGGRLENPSFPEISLGKSLADKILGPFDWDRAERHMAHGPGSTTRVRKRHAAAAYKYSGIPECTIGNAALGNACIMRNPVWEQTVQEFLDKDPEASDRVLGLVKITQGNRVTTVPKNKDTDRTIAKEPCMNMYVQKGIGGLLREKLRVSGCNLDDQTRNQRLALVGSLAGKLATIDLSMASDTISREVVSQYIRADWLEALEQTRSPFGVLPSGEKLFYQKFSSMGNGYTFELESLIFYTLALSVVHLMGEEVSRVSVYGDDVILPSQCAERFMEVISYLGFKPNMKKSFSSGPFRESCGKHYFLGNEITPFYIRKPVTKLHRLFLLHNNLWRWNERVKPVIGDERYVAVTKLLASLRHLAPSSWRKPRLPDGYGDGAFVGALSSITLTPHSGGWEFWEVFQLVQLPTEQDCEVPGLMVHGLTILERHAPPGHLSYMYPGPERRVQPTEVGGYKGMKTLIPRYAPGVSPVSPDFGLVIEA